uniref:FERM domain containing 3 n=1 Tax=Sinocyclocheilus rhinocerous TaxID=307959 RepID=A0A673HCU3_9TELE
EFKRLIKITTVKLLKQHLINTAVHSAGLSALKDSVHLSPLKPSVTPEEVEVEERENHVQEDEPVNRTRADEDVDHEDEACAALTISDTAYSPCASVVPTPVEESQGGLDLLFQSPARLLKELHADPEMQLELQAERERELAREAFRQSLCSPSSGRQQMQACLLSAARLVVMATGLLIILLPLLLVLLESDLDISFLHDIRQTPEFEQFHYEYYCPLRRWILCKLELMTEQFWGD